MRFPSKVTPYRESIMAQFPVVLSYLEKEEMSPSDLYEKVKRKVTNVAELVEILDCLFVLGRIELLNGEGMLRYVEDDTL